MLTSALGTASALCGAVADKVALYVCQPAQDGNHQPPGAVGRVGSWVDQLSAASGSRFHVASQVRTFLRELDSVAGRKQR